MPSEEDRIKMGVFSGIAHAMRYLHQNPRATETEVMQHVNSMMQEILDKIDNPY